MRRACLFSLLTVVLISRHAGAQPLPGTRLLDKKGDLARQMLDGIDRYLAKATQGSVAQHAQYWDSDKSIASNRARLKKIIGAVDPRLPINALEYVGSTTNDAVVARTKAYTIYAVRWPVLSGVFGEGLLLEPAEKPKAHVVVVPDADQTPEMWVGLAPGLTEDRQLARHLAEAGFRVVVPTVINRQDTWSGSEKLKRATNLTHREFIYRMAFEMGRHIIGYEVQKIAALVDWFSQDQGHPPIAVLGHGEGGLLALYCAALDTRIQFTAVSGYFGPREGVAQEPIYRNIWGQLRAFGDAEIARLILPRELIIWREPFQTGAPPAARAGRSGAAPGSFSTASPPQVMEELKRAMEAPTAGKKAPGADKPHVSDVGDFMQRFLAGLGAPLDKKRAPDATPRDQRKDFDPNLRQRRQFDQLVDYTQKLLPAAKERREEFFWSKLDTSSPEKFKKSQEPLREYFWTEIIGKLPEPDVPMNPRTRLIYETPKWKGYEVVLDVYDEVFSYGILLVPNSLKPGEKRPCVVCQHGLEGRPTDVVDPKKNTRPYHAYGAALADLGFVVFAPQNPYIFKNDFRQVLRKANPLQLSLYSFIVRQHQRILEWLNTLDFVDGSRIAFYGLSYGGKVAMRIPALLLDYCLSICSGDFNEWIWKNINLEWQGSYMFTGEYDMYEFDLGNTFNYAEMAALIAPRPFMVERGHADGVGLDEYVAFEYAKVRRFYTKLGFADRTEIEFFDGVHEIHLRGTLAFLRKHLRFPE